MKRSFGLLNSNSAEVLRTIQRQARILFRGMVDGSLPSYTIPSNNLEGRKVFYQTPSSSFVSLFSDLSLQKISPVLTLWAFGLPQKLLQNLLAGSLKRRIQKLPEFYRAGEMFWLSHRRKSLTVSVVRKASLTLIFLTTPTQRPNMFCDDEQFDDFRRWEFDDKRWRII